MSIGKLGRVPATTRSRFKGAQGRAGVAAPDDALAQKPVESMQGRGRSPAATHGRGPRRPSPHTRKTSDSTDERGRFLLQHGSTLASLP
jgi:hypothetical protein